MHPQLERAWQLHQAGQTAAAELGYRAILDAAPNDADALNCYGILLMQSTQVESALAIFRRASEQMPAHAGIQSNLARAALAVGDPATALAAAERAIANGGDNAATWQLLGNALKEMNRIDDAIAAFRKGRQHHPDDFQLHYNVAISELIAGRAEDAEKTFRDLVAKRPKQPQAWLGLANALSALARLNEAEEAYRRVLKDVPTLAQCWINLGMVLLRGGRRVEALDAFRHALSLKPANQSALAALSAISPGDAQILLDFDSILIDQPLSVASHGGPSDFNAALAAEILAQPVQQKDPVHKTTRGGFQTGNLVLAETPALAAFIAALRDELHRRIDTMAQRYAATKHPLAGSRPERWRVNLWATVLEQEGHQEPHLHPAGWLSGVYYVALPAVDENSQAGWIELGRPPSIMQLADNPTIRICQPKTGSMLTFPSYLHHRTLPHASDQPRISLAFDVIPLT
jgi:uncharacterized protein (TIGR02466 family)